MRTLAIDFGTRRIGLALSDAGGKWATPHSVLEVSDPSAAIADIHNLLRSEAVERLVVGLPLNMDGSIGPSARRAMQWARQLAAAAPGVSLVYVDERLSSFAAEQQLTARKQSGERLTRQAKKQRRDAIAAAAFLQEFLDGKLLAIEL